jgi:Protein of unknown function (DUF3592)
MFTFPWCGTNYSEFQQQCDRCGGSMPVPSTIQTLPDNQHLAKQIPAPPPPPRALPSQIIWRILLNDGWTISGAIIALIGLIFIAVGFTLTIGIITAIIGIPFAFIGMVLGGLGAALIIWRYQNASAVVEVLTFGKASQGEIINVHQDPGVMINGRYPWTIEYSFENGNDEYHGKITTINPPELNLLPGEMVYVLHPPKNPSQNTIYPSPYGSF